MQSNREQQSVDTVLIKQLLATDVALWNIVEPWTEQDVDTWSKLYADDVDYITGAGDWWTGRRQIGDAQKHYHDLLLTQNVIYEVTVKTISFLKSEVALVHADWRMSRASEDIKAILSLVMVKQDSHWIIRAGQVTKVNSPGSSQ